MDYEIYGHLPGSDHLLAREAGGDHRWGWIGEGQTFHPAAPDGPGEWFPKAATLKYGYLELARPVLLAEPQLRSFQESMTGR